MDVRGRSIIDSRGNPTVETDIILKNAMGRAAVPSGASVGTYEALELRDGGSAFHGLGVNNAVRNVNEIIRPKLIGKDIRKQKELDSFLCKLDGTLRKIRLGANTILSCSMAITSAAAASKKMPLFRYIGQLTDNKANLLPVPAMNVINGGIHADNDLDIQEHMILPVGAKSFKESTQMGIEIYFELRNLLKEYYGSANINVGDEGGFAPPLSDPAEPLDFIVNAIQECGYTGKVKLALDCAATEFFDSSKKLYRLKGKDYTSYELIDVYADLIAKYPIISVEDPFAEDDWDGFKEFTNKFGKKIQIIGDDLFVTNIDRLKRGVDTGACNCLLLKLNQIGTVTESFQAYKLASDHDYSVMVSHRSGETEDHFIADLVVGICSGQIKAGAPARSDRTAKYNQLIRIEEELGDEARFAGDTFSRFK